MSFTSISSIRLLSYCIILAWMMVVLLWTTVELLRWWISYSDGGVVTGMAVELLSELAS